MISVSPETFEAMSTAVIFLIAVVCCILARFLHVTDVAEKPWIYCGDLKFLETVRKACATLNEPFVPVGLWGRNGHLQTIIHGSFGRMRAPFLQGDRKILTMPDGATVTCDVFDSLEKDPTTDRVTLLICPGIANCSESMYVRAFVSYAQRRGYRCVVLNHLGALPDVRLTSPRIFTYGGTEEFHQMVLFATHRFPTAKFAVVGWSMGANIITKYLGENCCDLPSSLVCGISICQAYDALSAQPLLHRWDNFGRFYLWIMSEAVKGILRRFHDVLLSEGMIKRYQLDERKIFNSQSLADLDEQYTMKVAGFSSLTEYYTQLSSAHYMDDIKVPMMFVNSKDDPLVPPDLLEPPKKFVENHEKSLFVLTKHGGHLGFFEGGILFPDSVTWMDKMLIDYLDGVQCQL